MDIITFQPELRPELPDVFASKIALSRAKSKSLKKPFSSRCAQRHGRTFRLAPRYGILLTITMSSFRKLSRQVADSLLFQWFTHTCVRPVSKSSLERLEKLFPEDELAALIHEITGAAAAAAAVRPDAAKPAFFQEIPADFSREITFFIIL